MNKLVVITAKKTRAKIIPYTDETKGSIDLDNWLAFLNFCETDLEIDILDDNGNVITDNVKSFLVMGKFVVGAELSDGRYAYIPSFEPFETSDSKVSESEVNDFSKNIPEEVVKFLVKHPTASASQVQKYYLKIYNEMKKKDPALKTYKDDRRNISAYVSMKHEVVHNKAVEDAKKNQNEALKKVENLKIKLRQKIKQGARVGKVAGYKINKSSLTSKISSLSKIPNTVATPVLNQQIAKMSDIFTKDFIAEDVQFKKMKSAKLIIPNKKYDISGIKILKAPDTIYYKSLARAERDKLKFLLWYGCYVAATYFQMLVSNTPIDEPYSYKRKIVKSKKTKGLSKNGLKALSVNEVAKSANVSIGEREYEHKPDNSDVRGDWILTFRGKRIKAFDTEPFKYGPMLGSPDADLVLSREYFEKKVDQESIKIIAKKLYMLTKDSEDFSSTFSKENINPLWRVLEKGGYKNTSDPKTGPGGKYTHGVTDTHLTYQAPYGFIAITDATWDVLTSSGAWPGYVYDFVNGDMNKLDVSDINSKLMKKVLDKYPEIKKMAGKGKVRGVYKK